VRWYKKTNSKSESESEKIMSSDPSRTKTCQYTTGIFHFHTLSSNAMPLPTRADGTCSIKLHILLLQQHAAFAFKMVYCCIASIDYHLPTASNALSNEIALIVLFRRHLLVARQWERAMIRKRNRPRCLPHQFQSSVEYVAGKQCDRTKQLKPIHVYMTVR
jgi:hypothetical protein